MRPISLDAGSVHPAFLQTATAAPQIATGTAGPTEKDLPSLIQAAASRALFWRHGSFAQLDFRDRSVLAEVLRCVCIKSPSIPVYIRRTTLAERLSCSVPTITRALSKLASLGWINRDQIKSRARGFQVGSITLTEQAISMLGLNNIPASKTPTSQYKPNPSDQKVIPKKNLRESSVIDACLDSKEQSLQRQLAHAPGSVDNSENAQMPTADGLKFGPKDPKRIPESFRWLHTELKISIFGIFKLMRMASAQETRLEHIAAAARDAIKASAAPFSYIASLIKLDRDWEWLAFQTRTKDAEKRAEITRERERAAAPKAWAPLNGQYLIDKARAVAWHVCEDIAMGFRLDGEQISRTAIGARPMTLGFMKAISQGLLTVCGG